ncbi:MAG: hypothetical protein K2W97_02700 [Chthoniobacterales bacterium]|nr:hypothetical protein [Chthoniobacterales bacterium]
MKKRFALSKGAAERSKNQKKKNQHHLHGNHNVEVSPNTSADILITEKNFHNQVAV